MDSQRRSQAVGIALAALAVSAVLIASGARRAGGGELELRVTLASPLPGDLVALEVRPAWAGANSADERDTEWTRVPLVMRSVTLVPAGSATDHRDAVTVAAGSLPSGTYTRVFVAAPDIVGIAVDGSEMPLTSHVEPIVRPFSVTTGRRATVDLVWTVLPPTALHGGAPEVFVRDARLARAGSLSSPNSGAREPHARPRAAAVSREAASVVHTEPGHGRGGL